MASPAQLLLFSKKNKLPLILQTEIAECGLACLAMIACYHGHLVDLASLRRRFSMSLKGTTLKDLIDIADRLQLASRPLKLELEDINKLKTPAILHWDMNHFVVLKSAGRGRVTVHDPGNGERTLEYHEASKHFTGVALELTPTGEFKPQAERQEIRLRDFWRDSIGIKRSLIQLLLLSIALQAFALVSPFYMQLVVDQAIVGHDQGLLKVLAIGFLLLLLIKLGTEALRSFVILYFGNMLSFQIGVNLFHHLIRLPLDYFEKRHIGDVVSRFGSMKSVQKLLTTDLVSAAVDGIMTISTLVMMIIYAQRLALVVVFVVSIYAFFRYLLYRPLRQLTEDEIVAKAKEDSNFMETVRGIQSIKIFGRESNRQTIWQNRFADSANLGIRLGKLRIGYSTMNSILFGLENILVIYLGADMVLGGAFTVGMLYAFVAYKDQFSEKAAALVEQMIEFKMLGLHLNRLADITLTRKEVTQDPTTSSTTISGQLELRQVSYRYSESEPFTFRNLDVTVEPGGCIAIIGPSGCGKTTLMKVMMGLFSPQEGSVLLDGEPIAKIGLSSYRSQVAAVMQDDQLLSGSIADNIAFFDAEQDQKWVLHCAKLAAIHHDVIAMPMGYNSLIGDMGTMLSGGQKQRILLARALYRQPKILFLDEATSHLDTQLESCVNAAIKTLAITRIIIAHRPDTIQSADRILLFESGQLQDITTQIKSDINLRVPVGNVQPA